MTRQFLTLTAMLISWAIAVWFAVNVLGALFNTTVDLLRKVTQ